MSQLDLFLQTALNEMPQNPAAHSFMEKWRRNLQDARNRLVEAQNDQAKHYNAKHRSLQFEVGERVLLSSKSLTAPTDRGTQWKLRHQWYGPLTITEAIYGDNDSEVPVSYRLNLPPQWRVHNVFSVSKLKPYIEIDVAKWPGRKKPQPPPTQLVDNQAEYVVEEILGYRDVQRGRGKRREWLVRFEGYGPMDDMWLTLQDLNTGGMISDHWLEFEKSLPEDEQHPEFKRIHNQATVPVRAVSVADQISLLTQFYEGDQAYSCLDQSYRVQTGKQHLRLRVLVLFSGTGSVEKAVLSMFPGAEITSLDIKGKHVTHQCDIRQWVNWPEEYPGGMRDYPPGYFDIVWASPPCTEYSRAKTIGARDLKSADYVVACTLHAINYLRPAFFFIENPEGLLRHRHVMFALESMRHKTSYCRYGTDYRKDTNIWTNVYLDKPLPVCSVNSPCTHVRTTGVHPATAQRGVSSSGSSGTSIKTVYQIPPGLLRALFRRAVRSMGRVI